MNTPALPQHDVFRPGPGDEAHIRAALEAALSSRVFSTADRLRRFLRFIVEEALAGRGAGLKEYVIGTEVCDRPADFDPRADPVVRVEARRLRARLADYYADEGRDAPLVIIVPKGGYVPSFARRVANVATDPPPGDAGANGRNGDRVAGAFAEGEEPTVVADENVAMPPLAAGAPGWRLARLGQAMAALLFVGLAATAWWAWTRSRPLPDNGVAVLPFRNASADPENDYFCFGLAEDLTGALTEVHGLRVVARTSAEQVAEVADVQEAGRRLRVRHIVEGSVRREGQRVRVTARLVDTADATPVWTQAYDRELRDALALQDELARAIAGALVPRLGLGNGQARAHPAPRNAEAHGLYRRGQFLFRTQPGSQAQAADYLARSLASDPEYAPAHLELAAIHATRALDQVAPSADDITQARRGVERALQLDPVLADAVALKAWIRFFNDWDWADAERLFLEALRLNPSSSVAHHRYALLLMTAGRFDEAIRHGEQALDLDPLSYRLVNGCAVVAFCARRYGDAERLAREATQLAPRYFLAHLILGSTLVAQDRVEAGIAAYRAALDVQRGEPDATASLGRALAIAGRRDEAQALLAQLEAPDARVPPSRYEVAFLLAALGQRDRALAALEASLARHETELVYLGVDPLFDPLRGEPRFDAVLRAIGVPGR